MPDPYRRFLDHSDITSRKHGGNAESEAAFSSHQRSFTKTQKEVAHLYRSIYPQALTPKEVAKMLDKPLHSISGRCTEGKQDGWLEPTGEVRDGSRALVWVKEDQAHTQHLPEDREHSDPVCPHPLDVCISQSAHSDICRFSALQCEAEDSGALQSDRRTPMESKHGTLQNLCSTGQPLPTIPTLRPLSWDQHSEQETAVSSSAHHNRPWNKTSDYELVSGTACDTEGNLALTANTVCRSSAERLPLALPQASDTPNPRAEIKRLFEAGREWDAIDLAYRTNIGIRVELEAVTI